MRVLLAAVALFTVQPTFAQEPAGTPLCVQLSQNWQLHPLAGVTMGGYDVTHGTLVAALSLNGLYEARYKDVVGFAAGFGLQTGPLPGATITGLVTLPYYMSAGVQYVWIGGVHDVIVLVAPTYRF